ncbi:hypothetical protein TNCV_852631 [Trichonephila clavipes]|nr:hypothetical protein TNCV_852631 [Trichonephila clavipes]
MHLLHPCMEFLDFHLRRRGSIWKPAEQICRWTNITSEEHLGWVEAGGLMDGAPVGEQKKKKKKKKEAVSCPSLIDYIIPEERERETAQNGSIELLYHAVGLRM